MKKCLNNFKSSSNKRNCLSVVKRIVNSPQESVYNGNADDVMIKIYRLCVYIIIYFKWIMRILVQKKEWVKERWSDEIKMVLLWKRFLFCDKVKKWIQSWVLMKKVLNYFMRAVKTFLSKFFLKEKFHHL